MSSADAIGLLVLLVMGGVVVFTKVKRKLEEREPEWEPERVRQRRRTEPRLPHQSRSRSTARLTVVDEYVERRFGNGARKYKWCLPIDFKLLRDIQAVVNECETTSEEVLRFKESQMIIFTSNATAGSIYSTVAISALRLTDLHNLHWTATAFLLAGLATGALSVWVACSMQQILGLLHIPKEIRYWLAARPPGIRDGCLVLESSIWTTIILSVPRVLIGCSIASTLTGICLYLVFSWINSPNVSWGPSGYRNVMISFLLTTGICIFILGILFGLKWLEDNNMAMDEEVKNELRHPNLAAEAESSYLGAQSSSPHIRTWSNIELSSTRGTEMSLLKALQDATSAINRNNARQEELIDVLQNKLIVTKWHELGGERSIRDGISTQGRTANARHTREEHYRPRRPKT